MEELVKRMRATKLIANVSDYKTMNICGHLSKHNVWDEGTIAR